MGSDRGTGQGAVISPLLANIWQFVRQNWLSNRVFKSFDDIVDHCCYAWNTLIDQPWKIMSIAQRDWATVGYPMM